MALRSVPFHRSLTRHNLFMGGDREMVMVAGLLSFTLIFAAMSFISFIYGVLLWVVCLYFLRQMAKADPEMRNVYLRHIKYKKFYPAHSTPLFISKREYH